MKLVTGASTDVGRQRAANEDAYLVDPDRSLYAVADGMGGHRAGEVASAAAIEALAGGVGTGMALVDAVASANTRILERAGDDPELAGMGTTLTAMTMRGGSTAVLAHVGDSRAYLLRNGDLVQVTEDHSVVEGLVREGRITPEQAEHHPSRSMLTRALGVDHHVEVAGYEVDLLPGDRLMLCSDGLTTMMRDREIAVVLRAARDPLDAASTLVDAANRAGGADNITVVVLDVVAEEGDEPAAAPVGDAAVVRATPSGHWELEADLVDPTPGAGAAVATTGASARRPWRTVVFVGVPVLLVVLIGLGAVGWYARRTYYVGLDGDRVALYQGVPGGLLWWDETVERRSDVTVDELTVAQRVDLGDGHRFSSLDAATRFLARIEHDAEGDDAKATDDAAPERTDLTGSGPTGSGPTGGGR